MTLETWLILPDAHTPYHDKRAIRLIFNQVLHAVKFDGVVILGDWFDNYGISRFAKDPRRLQGLRRELAVGFDLMKQLEAYPFKRRIFLEGNHELRLPKMLSEKAPEVYEIVMSWWAERFANWEYVPYMHDIAIGKLYLTHDVGRSGVHSTKQTLNDYQDNVIIGHNHRFDFTVGGNAKGRTHVGASFGWLGDLNAIDYRHRMKSRREWTLGFGVVRVRPDGVVFVEPHPIVEYTTTIDGKYLTCSSKS